MRNTRLGAGARRLAELGELLEGAERAAPGLAESARIRNAHWSWRFTEAALHGLRHQARGHVHFARARDTAVGNAAAREPDGRYRRFDVERGGLVYTCDEPATPRGYEEAAAELGQALDHYRRAAVCLTEELPAGLRSSWITTGFGFARMHDGLVRRLELMRRACEARRPWL